MKYNTIQLKEITTKITKGTTPTTLGYSFCESGINFIKAESVTLEGRIDDSIFMFIGAETDEKLKRSRIEAKDILFSIAGMKLGKSAIVKEEHVPANTNQALAIIRVDQSKALPEYIHYQFQNPRFYKMVNSITAQAAQPNINLTQVGELPVLLPPHEEQHKIVSILSAYDDLIENNLRRIRILEEMAQLIYREWFIKFHFPGHEKVKMVDSPLGKIPEGWEILTLQEVCSLITDGSHWSPKADPDGVPMASVKDMHDWGFYIDKCKRIGRDDYEKLIKNNCQPQVGDVLIAKDGSYLKHTFVVNETMELALLSSIAILRPNEKIIPQYLALYLKDEYVKARMSGYVSGVALPRIILNDFRRFSILMPPMEVQNQWHKHANHLISLIWCLLEKNRILRESRDLLLPKLISGQLDVSELDIDIGETVA